MITVEMLCRTVRGLDEREVREWVAQSLVRPEGDAERPRFTEQDVARVRLIAELRHELEVEEPTLPLVLSLLDQLYRERARLRLLAEAVQRTSAPEQLQQLLAALGIAQGGLTSGP